MRWICSFLLLEPQHKVWSNNHTTLPLRPPSQLVLYDVNKGFLIIKESDSLTRNKSVLFPSQSWSYLPFFIFAVFSLRFFTCFGTLFFLFSLWASLTIFFLSYEEPKHHSFKASRNRRFEQAYQSKLINTSHQKCRSNENNSERERGKEKGSIIWGWNCTLVMTVQNSN